MECVLLWCKFPRTTAAGAVEDEEEHWDVFNEAEVGGGGQFKWADDEIGTSNDDERMTELQHSAALSLPIFTSSFRASSSSSSSSPSLLAFLEKELLNNVE